MTRATQTYRWQGRNYLGLKAVAEAAGVTQRTVSHHLTKHGSLDRLGQGPGRYPGSGDNLRRTRSKPIAGFPSIRAFADHVGVARQTAELWIREGKADRILAALMAAQARAAA